MKRLLITNRTRGTFRTGRGLCREKAVLKGETAAGQRENTEATNHGSIQGRALFELKRSERTGHWDLESESLLFF